MILLYQCLTEMCQERLKSKITTLNDHFRPGPTKTTFGPMKVKPSERKLSSFTYEPTLVLETLSHGKVLVKNESLTFELLKDKPPHKAQTILKKHIILKFHQCTLK